MQTELNQLSPADLQTQVNLIESDLRSWVSNNFILDSNQQAYLQQMDARFLSFAGNLTGFAVANNLTVSLTIQPNNPPKTLKLVHVINNIDCTNSPNGFSATGSVSYVVEFQ